MSLTPPIGRYEWIDAVKRLANPAHSATPIVLPWAEHSTILWDNGDRNCEFVDGVLICQAQIETEDEWQRHRWNPPHGAFEASYLFPPETQDADPRASVKPTWAQIVEAIRYNRLVSPVRQRNLRNALTVHAEAAATLPVPHPHAAAPAHVGGGISHMAAMMKHAADATAAGERWPVAVLRDVEGGELRLHTDTEAHDILGPVSKNENRAESAKNIVQIKAGKLLKVIHDEHGGLEPDADEEAKLTAREAAATAYDAMIDGAAAEYAKALAEVDAMVAGELPDDLPLPRLKHIYIRWLEQAATAKVESLLNAAGQQGMDLAASCRDQSDALEAVSDAKQRHQILIERADDAADAKFKYGQAVAAIEKISAQRTPFWYGSGGRLIEGDDAAYSSQSAFVQARSPVESKVSGSYEVIANEDGTGPNPHATARLEKTGDNMSYFLGVTEGTEPATYKLIARNICGPSELTVVINAPEPPPAT